MYNELTSHVAWSMYIFFSDGLKIKQGINILTEFFVDNWRSPFLKQNTEAIISQLLSDSADDRPGAEATLHMLQTQFPDNTRQLDELFAYLDAGNYMYANILHMLIKCLYLNKKHILLYMILGKGKALDGSGPSTALCTNSAPSLDTVNDHQPANETGKQFLQ